MFSTAVAVALSVVFLATGVIGTAALVRGARTGAPGGCGDTRATELLHVVMSLAMIAMAWGLTAGPDTVGGAAQVVVFGVALVALVAALARDARRGLRHEARRARLSHGLTAAATVWMVVTMPLLMAAGAGPGAAGTTASMPGMPGMPGMAHGAHATAPATGAVGTQTAGWASVASTALVVVLVVVGLAWAVRAVQLGSPAHRALAHGGSDAPVIPTPRRAPDGVVARALAPVGGTTAAARAQAPASRPARPAAATATRHPLPPARPATVAASCHALMSLGMAGMLAAML